MALTYLFSAISIVGLLISIISLLRASSGAVPSIHLLPPNIKTDENTNFRILIHNPSPRMVFLSKIEISYPDEFKAYPIGVDEDGAISRFMANASKKNKKVIDILLYIPPHQKREIQLNLKTIDSGLKFRTHWLKSGIFFDRLLFPFFSIKFTAKELEAIQIAYGHEEDGKT